jgi:hypothetical protein
MAFNALCDIMKGKSEHDKGKRIEGIAVVLKKNVLNGGDCKAPMFDRFAEMLGKGISFELVSSTHKDPGYFLFLVFYIIHFLNFP